MLLKISEIDSTAIVNCRHGDTDTSGLAESIESSGLQMPLGVCRLKDGYGLVYGFRRLSAIKSLGWTEVECRLVESNEVSDLLVLNLQENVAREGLNPMEEALALKRIIDSGADLDVVKARLGWTKTLVTQRLALLEMTSVVKDALAENQITINQARVIDKQAEDDHSELVEFASKGATTKQIREEAEILEQLRSRDDFDEDDPLDGSTEFDFDDDSDDELETVGIPSNDEVDIEIYASSVQAALLDIAGHSIKADAMGNDDEYAATRANILAVNFSSLSYSEIVCLNNALIKICGVDALNCWGVGNGTR